MKPHRDASELAARLSAAANKPVPLPTQLVVVEQPTPKAADTPVETRAKKLKQAKAKPETVPITLRPSRATLTRYVLAAADRTRQLGRVISAQDIMLEKLEEAS